MNCLEYLRFKLKAYLRKTPMFYKSIKTFQGAFSSPSWRLCNKNSDLCLEAYPGSANSFAYALLVHLNKDLNIAHHTHSVANIKIALRYNVPTIVIIRNPLHAIGSRVLRFGSKIEQSIFEYIDFYKFVENHFDELIVVSFQDVINDTTGFVNRITGEAGISFFYDDLTTVRKEVFSKIEGLAKSRGNEDKIPLPLPKRKLEKKNLTNSVAEHESFKQADLIYRKTLEKYSLVKG